MKAVSLNAPANTGDAVKSTTAATGESGSTDFLALFLQALSSGTTAGEESANLLGAALDLTQQDEGESGEGELDEADLAALLATLTGANAPTASAVQLEPQLAAAATKSSTARTGDLSGRPSELAGAVMNALVAQTAAEVAGSEGADIMGIADAAPADATPDGTAAVDPRLGHTVLDSIRETRVAQTDAPTTQRQMHATVGTRAWSEELGNQINWMTDRGQQSASLRLSPEHLGPLEIQISIQDDKASVWFGAAHADTRAAIEDALPRLREMLASQGLSLNDAGVFKEPPRQQGQHGADSDSVDSTAPAEEVQEVRLARLGLVDTYA